ncbi:type III secretion system cytoplasmic ring protein SctQ [uncultured Tateyamaria sp.]|uniref:type III secretion system cytoplasmic ring protein SctQ n=1 Tax=uncultured Tateyamaria sp. TaxID=455651 RepID=UPI002612C744|nr:type III secretion system cytoplasmic ring protein SctQ [uncultured Tateyamaria sp.]
MGLHTKIPDAESQRFEELDWTAFHAQLPPAVAGPPFVARRRTIDLGADIVASVTLEEWTSPPEPDAEAVETTVRFGTTRADLQAPWQVVQALVDAHGIDQDCEILPASVMSMVAEHLLEPVLKPLEKALGGHCRIGPDPTDVPASTYLCLMVALGGHSHRMVLSTDQGAADQLLALFPPASPLTPVKVPDRMVMPIALHSPDVSMAAGTLAEFGMGDVLLPDAGWPVMTQGTLMCGAHALGAVTRNPETQTVTLAALTDSDILTRNDDMTQTETLPRPATGRSVTRRSEPGAQAALENLNVTVSVELSRSELPLGDLRKLTVGTVLPFECTLGDPVTLLANGAPFASGELVRLGERIGVRLLALD